MDIKNILLTSYPDKILTFYEFTILIERKYKEKKRIKSVLGDSKTSSDLIRFPRQKN